MKKLIVAALLCGSAVSSFGQGTVNFSNLSTALSSPPDRLIRFGVPGSEWTGPPAGAPASTNLINGLVAQLYYGASTAAAGSLVAVSSAPGGLRSSTSASVGTWFGNGSRTLTGFNPGDTVNLQVRVWDISKGTDYNQVAYSLNNDLAFAIAYMGVIGNWIGCSAVFQYTIPTNPTPAPSEFNMNNFVGFSLEFPLAGCPEPTPLALAGLGAALLLFRRRK
jgi:hypothetical protein